MPETSSTTGGRVGSGEAATAIGSEVDSAVGASSAAELESHKDPDVYDSKGKIKLY